VKRRKGEPPEVSKNLKNYGIGAQILVDLGVKRMRLLSDSEQHVVGIEGYGLEIVGHQKFDEDLKKTIFKSSK